MARSPFLDPGAMPRRRNDSSSLALIRQDRRVVRSDPGAMPSFSQHVQDMLDRIEATPVALKGDTSYPLPERRYLAVLRATGMPRTAMAAAEWTEVAKSEAFNRGVGNGFLEACDGAQQFANGIVAGEAVRRAVSGVREPIVSGGAILGEKLAYSDSLMMPLLRRLPEFEDRRQAGAGAGVSVHVVGKGVFTFRFEGDGLGPLSRNGDDLIDGTAEELDPAAGRISAPEALPEAVESDLP